MRNDRSIEVEPIAQWAGNLAPWQEFATLTWRPRDYFKAGRLCATRGISQDAAARQFERFMEKEFRLCNYFYAIERNPSVDGHHVHAMLCAPVRMHRGEMWELWFGEKGRARIEPIRNQDDVTAYCAKYVCKQGSWWNFKLADSQLWRAAKEGRKGGFGYEVGERYGLAVESST